jgi:hypothetical protein
MESYLTEAMVVPGVDDVGVPDVVHGDGGRGAAALQLQHRLDRHETTVLLHVGLADATGRQPPTLRKGLVSGRRYED